jgi:hypothetical protein
MATITVEDGTGLANATSYASEAELTAYNTERNVTLGATNGSASEILIKAMDYLESKTFIGDKYVSTQALQWPRLNVVVDGFYIDRDDIPLLLKEAQIEIAISIDSGVDPLVNQARETVREKVGDIEVEYSNQARAVEYLTAAETKLCKLVKSNMGTYRA